MSVFFSIFFISFSLLSYEILLMRILSITSWSHFAYMVISVALLGFGASGSFISLFKNIVKKHFNLFFLLFSFLFPISLFLCSFFSQFIKFDPFLIVWYRKQYLYLLEYYLVLFIPFFLGASCIGLAFLQFDRLIPRLYFFNLLGSAAGSLGVVLLMYLFSPVNLILLLIILGFLAVVIFSWSLKRKIFGMVLLASLCLGTIFYLYPPQLHISQYKALSISLNLPGARILKEKFSPFGLIDVLKSPAIRCAPGLSFNFKGDFPPQLGLFTDADSISAINYFDGDLFPLSYLDYITASVPYHLIKTPQVLVIGSGGGSSILNALYHRASKIDAVEVNPQVVDLVNREYGDFSGHIYSLPQVRAIIAEGRGFIESTSKRYDLIDISLLDSFSASSAGVYDLSENYLYTVEALESFLKALMPQGILSITRWVKIPPRDGIKLFASAVEALKKIGVKSPSSHLIFIRSWSTCTLLVSKSPFTLSQIHQAEEFSQERAFDLIWTSDIDPKKVNQYNILPQAYYYNAAKSIISERKEKFYQDYLFNVNPATDNSPYFFHFFKWQSLPHLLKTMGREWIPFVEWGYIILIATLLQAVGISVLLIILPLLFLKKEKGPAKGKLQVLLYFFFLGVSYMFIEISFIQKFTLFLYHPIYSASVVISAFLGFSSLGSRFCERIRLKRISTVGLAVTGITVISLVYLVVLKDIFPRLLFLPYWIKIVISIGLIAPLAFFMGMPFPLGLSKVSSKFSELVPWAWGINGCASVISAILATVLAISWGFNLVGILAIALYIGAYLSFK